MDNLFYFEETEKTDNGLDWVIKDWKGDWVAWAYSAKWARMIVDGLNSKARDEDER